MTSPAPRLELLNITKRYPTVVANENISLTVMPGEIHALLGENGAGKSTLVKIIYGAVKADSGSIRMNGAEVDIANPAHHNAPELYAAVVVNIIAVVLKLGDRTQMGRCTWRPAWSRRSSC